MNFLSCPEKFLYSILWWCIDCIDFFSFLAFWDNVLWNCGIGLVSGFPQIEMGIWIQDFTNPTRATIWFLDFTKRNVPNWSEENFYQHMCNYMILVHVQLNELPSMLCVCSWFLIRHISVFKKYPEEHVYIACTLEIQGPVPLPTKTLTQMKFQLWVLTRVYLVREVTVRISHRRACMRFERVANGAHSMD